MKPAVALCLCLLGACSSEITEGADQAVTVDASVNSIDMSAPVVDLARASKPDDAGCGTTVMNECQSDADCNDGNPATTDVCQMMSGGEFPTGTCLHIACDGGLNCAMQAIDPGCSGKDAGVVYPPFVPLTPPDVPASCANGFQLADALGAPLYVIHSMTAAGARAITLDLDFATYTAPDGLLITAVDSSCRQYALFDSCRLKTADQGENAYTNGKHRPSDPAIRQYHLALRPGTTQITFDFSRVVSPMYVQVLGLCDFTLPPAQGVGWFALVP